MPLLKKSFFFVLILTCLIAVFKYSDKIIKINRPKSLSDNFKQVTLRPSLQSSNVSLKNLLQVNISETTSGAELETLFTTLAMSTEANCPQVLRMGNTADGGWSSCVSNGLAFKSPCLVYSFGINNDWSFDDAVVKTFGCTVRSFDPSMSLSNQKRGANIHFYKEGLAGQNVITKDKMWRLNTLSSFLEIFNERNVTIDYLKIDIEYYEWEALETALRDGSLQFVKQLGFEIHTDELYQRTTSIQNYKRFFKIFKGLRDAGFYKWYTHLNPMSIAAVSNYTKNSVKCCYEFVYININLE